MSELRKTHLQSLIKFAGCQWSVTYNSRSRSTFFFFFTQLEIVYLLLLPRSNWNLPQYFLSTSGLPLVRRDAMMHHRSLFKHLIIIQSVLRLKEKLKYKTSKKDTSVTLSVTSVLSLEPWQPPDRWCTCATLNRDGKEAKRLTHLWLSSSAQEESYYFRLFKLNITFILRDVRTIS